MITILLGVIATTMTGLFIMNEKARKPVLIAALAMVGFYFWDSQYGSNILAAAYYRLS